jgi:hypothetical protein
MGSQQATQLTLATHATYYEQACEFLRSFVALIILILNFILVRFATFHALLEQVGEQQAAQLTVTTHATYHEQAHQLARSLATLIIILIFNILTLIFLATLHSLLE